MAICWAKFIFSDLHWSSRMKFEQDLDVVACVCETGLLITTHPPLNNQSAWNVYIRSERPTPDCFFKSEDTRICGIIIQLITVHGLIFLHVVLCLTGEGKQELVELAHWSGDPPSIPIPNSIQTCLSMLRFVLMPWPISWPLDMGWHGDLITNLTIWTKTLLLAASYKLIMGICSSFFGTDLWITGGFSFEHARSQAGVCPWARLAYGLGATVVLLCLGTSQLWNGQNFRDIMNWVYSLIWMGARYSYKWSHIYM